MPSPELYGLRQPPEPYELAAGYHWSAEECGEDWRLVTKYTKCRQLSCREPPVAELARRTYLHTKSRTVDRWWAYCRFHLYGRWIIDGKIMQWIVREDVDPDKLLAELNALCRIPSKDWPHDGGKIAHKFNQLNDWISMGGRLPHSWTPALNQARVRHDLSGGC